MSSLLDVLSSAGDKFSDSGHKFGELLYPVLADRATFHSPTKGFLQAYGVVPEEEIRHPKDIDINGLPCLFVIKNGFATGTTIGRANRLESFLQKVPEYGMEGPSIVFAVLGYATKYPKFSGNGDSGSIVLARDGRIVGILTAGGGCTEETDITYLTPYYWLEQEIKAKYPGCFLYEPFQ